MTESTKDNIIISSSYLLMICLPFGETVHNLTCGLVSLILISLYLKTFQDNKKMAIRPIQKKLFINNKFVTAMICLIIFHLIAIISNTNSQQDIITLINNNIGHVFFFVIPILFAINISGRIHIDSDSFIKIFTLTTTIILGFYLIDNYYPDMLTKENLALRNNSISQIILIILPIVFFNFLKDTKSLQNNVIFFFILGFIILGQNTFLCILASLCFISCGYSVFEQSSKRLLTILTAIILVMSNVSFNQSRNGTPDVEIIKDKLDKIKKRSLLGHGSDKSVNSRPDNLTSQKMQYVEILIQSGIIGLFFFLACFYFILSTINTDILSKTNRAILNQTITLFLASSFFYEGFLNSEVRYLIMMYMSWLASYTMLEGQPDYLSA